MIEKYLLTHKRINIKVRPGARESKIIGFNSELLEVDLSSPPVDGKANVELIKLLWKKLGIKVRIVSGISSRRKVVEVI